MQYILPNCLHLDISYVTQSPTKKIYDDQVKTKKKNEAMATAADNGEHM